MHKDSACHPNTMRSSAIAQSINQSVIHILSPMLEVAVNTVWPEILAGIYFGGLLKFLYLAEFTLAVLANSLCHNDIHSKMANPDEQC